MKQDQGGCQKIAICWTSYSGGHYGTCWKQVGKHKYNKGFTMVLKELVLE